MSDETSSAKKLDKTNCINFFSYIVQHLTDENKRAAMYDRLEELGIEPIFESYKMHNLNKQEYRINIKIDNEKYQIVFSPCQEKITLVAGMEEKKKRDIIRKYILNLSKRLFFTDAEFQLIIEGRGKEVAPKHKEWDEAYGLNPLQAEVVTATVTTKSKEIQPEVKAVELPKSYATPIPSYKLEEAIRIKIERVELPEPVAAPTPSSTAGTKTKEVMPRMSLFPSKSKLPPIDQKSSGNNGLTILENGKIVGSVAKFIKDCIEKIKAQPSFNAKDEYGGNQVYSADFIKITSDEKNNKFELEFTSAKSQNKKVIVCTQANGALPENVTIKNKSLLGAAAKKIEDETQELADAIREIGQHLEIKINKDSERPVVGKKLQNTSSNTQSRG